MGVNCVSSMALGTIGDVRFGDPEADQLVAHAVRDRDDRIGGQHDLLLAGVAPFGELGVLGHLVAARPQLLEEASHFVDDRQAEMPSQRDRRHGQVVAAQSGCHVDERRPLASHHLGGLG